MRTADPAIMLKSAFILMNVYIFFNTICIIKIASKNWIEKERLHLLCFMFAMHFILFGAYADGIVSVEVPILTFVALISAEVYAWIGIRVLNTKK